MVPREDIPCLLTHKIVSKHSWGISHGQADGRSPGATRYHVGRSREDRGWGTSIIEGLLGKGEWFHPG